MLKNKFCSILTFLANLDKKKKIKNVNLARLCARLKPVFLSKKGPSKARLLTKMSPSEELGTLSSREIFQGGGRELFTGGVGEAERGQRGVDGDGAEPEDGQEADGGQGGCHYFGFGDFEADFSSVSTGATK